MHVPLIPNITPTHLPHSHMCTADHVQCSCTVVHYDAYNTNTVQSCITMNTLQIHYSAGSVLVHQWCSASVVQCIDGAMIAIVQ